MKELIILLNFVHLIFCQPQIGAFRNSNQNFQQPRNQQQFPAGSGQFQSGNGGNFPFQQTNNFQSPQFGGGPQQQQLQQPQLGLPQQQFGGAGGPQSPQQQQQLLFLQQQQLLQQQQRFSNPQQQQFSSQQQPQQLPPQIFQPPSVPQNQFQAGNRFGQSAGGFPQQPFFQSFGSEFLNSQRFGHGSQSFNQPFVQQFGSEFLNQRRPNFGFGNDQFRPMNRFRRPQFTTSTTTTTTVTTPVPTEPVPEQQPQAETAAPQSLPVDPVPPAPAPEAPVPPPPQPLAAAVQPFAPAFTPEPQPPAFTPPPSTQAPAAIPVAPENAALPPPPPPDAAPPPPAPAEVAPPAPVDPVQPAPPPPAEPVPVPPAPAPPTPIETIPAVAPPAPPAPPGPISARRRRQAEGFVVQGEISPAHQREKFLSRVNVTGVQPAAEQFLKTLKFLSNNEGSLEQNDLLKQLVNAELELLVRNWIFNEELAGEIASTFSIPRNAGVKMMELTPADVDDIEFQGNSPTSNKKFKVQLQELLWRKIDQQYRITSDLLADLSDALLTLLNGNGVVKQQFIEDIASYFYRADKKKLSLF